MHDTALRHAALFFDTYVPRAGHPHIVEIGSADVNGTLRRLAPVGSEYVGVDHAAGPGVDIVIDGDVLPMNDDSVDVCLTSSCFEHARFFWQTMTEVARVLKPGGLFYLNAPAYGPYHAHPSDCWRFFPDSGRALAEWTRHQGYELVLLESFVAFPGEVWTDFVAVFWKPGHAPEAPCPRMLDSVRGYAQGWRLDPAGALQPAAPMPATPGMILANRWARGRFRLRNARARLRARDRS